MSEPERLGQSDFIRIAQKLHAAQLAAVTIEARQAADEDLWHFMRMAAHGRLQEWAASREDA